MTQKRTLGALLAMATAFGSDIPKEYSNKLRFTDSGKIGHSSIPRHNTDKVKAKNRLRAKISRNSRQINRG